MPRFGKTEVSLSNTISSLVNQLNNVADDLGNIDNIADSNLVNAVGTLQTNINSSDSDIGTRTSLATTNKSDLVSAINEIHAIVSPFNIVLDTTPQLGGNLDLNSKNVTGTGNISITGSLTTTAAITSGSANITTTGNITGPVTQADITTVRLATGGWTITQSGTNLIFDYNGSDKMKLDASGNLTVVGNVTAFGTI